VTQKHASMVISGSARLTLICVLIELFFVNKYKDIILKCSETFWDRYGMEDLKWQRSNLFGSNLYCREAPTPLYVSFTETV